MNNEREAGVSTSEPEIQPKLPGNEDLVRLILAVSTVVLIFVALLIYAITREIMVLGATSVIGSAEFIVFKYYFPNPKQ